MIVIKNLNKFINKKHILNDISISFQEGKIYGIVGKNGSGKTMLLRAICGLITPSSGEITFSNNPSFGVIIESPGFMFEQTALFNLQYLSSLNKKASKERIEGLLVQYGLYEHRNQKVKKYSLGMQQKLGIIQAIMDNPSIVILDEPFNALDDTALNLVKKSILEMNKNNNTTFFIASHDIETIEEICDSIVVIKNGCIN
jgi:ABC-2 type transport system ATP-binding protein